MTAGLENAQFCWFHPFNLPHLRSQIDRDQQSTHSQLTTTQLTNMNRIPSFIVIPNLPSGSNDTSISMAVTTTNKQQDELLDCPPPPPALERWSSEGSADCDHCAKCNAPPTLPARRCSYHQLKAGKEEITKAEEQQCVSRAPRLPLRRSSTHAPSAMDLKVQQLNADRWN